MRTFDLVILESGEIQAIVNGDVTFEQASAMSEELSRELGQVIAITWARPEQHKDGKQRHVHIVGTHRHG